MINESSLFYRTSGTGKDLDRILMYYSTIDKNNQQFEYESMTTEKRNQANKGHYLRNRNPAKNEDLLKIVTDESFYEQHNMEEK